MKIEWAPVNVPLRRRLQTLAAGIYALFTFTMHTTFYVLTCKLLVHGNYLIKLLMLAYFAYIYYDNVFQNTAVNGNGWMFMRTNFIWRHLREYFPVELVKTADLSPDRNYVFASFPHGIICTGISINMLADISKWIKLFPGIRPKIATIDMQFYTPFWREVLKRWGLIPVSKESLLYHLGKSNDLKHPDNSDGFTSNAIAILVGGAQETLDSHPGRYIITVRRRKGFVKMAIRTGSPIVPNFTFGEVDVFDQVDNPPESRLRRFQLVAKKWTGIPFVLFMGRGIFQYTFGYLPQRRRIVQVVGTPIEVKKDNNPDPVYVDEIHQKVMSSLNDLFETHKSKYLKNAHETQLIMT